MATSLPYLTSPGTVKTAFERIKQAATPPKFTNDFVQTKLKIKGGTGSSIPPFLKKIGLVGSDGSPTTLYQKFRNTASSGAAIAEAIRIGYKSLYEVNEYAHEASDLKGLIVQVTGLEENAPVVDLIKRTFVNLKAEADFESKLDDAIPTEREAPTTKLSTSKDKTSGLNISYTINLNLPATTNIEVFNAIFKSLRENLLGNDEQS